MILAALFLALAVPLQTACPAPSTCTVYQQAIVSNVTGASQRLTWGYYTDEINAHVVEWEAEVLEFPPKDGALPILSKTIPAIGTTGVAPNFPMIFPKAGTYYARVRTCYAETLPRQCSRWVNTYDPADTSPQAFPRGFFFNIRLAPVTGGGVS